MREMVNAMRAMEVAMREMGIAIMRAMGVAMRAMGVVIMLAMRSAMRAMVVAIPYIGLATLLANGLEIRL